MLLVCLLSVGFGLTELNSMSYQKVQLLVIQFETKYLFEEPNFVTVPGARECIQRWYRHRAMFPCGMDPDELLIDRY